MNIIPVEEKWLRLAEERQLRLTKPPRSLGRLEEISNRLAAIQQTETPAVRKPTIIVFAGDHGVCEEGVNPYPQVVTSRWFPTSFKAVRQLTFWAMRRART